MYTVYVLNNINGINLLFMQFLLDYMYTVCLKLHLCKFLLHYMCTVLLLNYIYLNMLIFK